MVVRRYPASGVATVFMLSLLCHVQSSRDVQRVQRRETQDNQLERVNTTDRLVALRNKTRTRGLDAYIVPSTDAHQSVDIARREYLSGFTGSAGEAVITMSKAALWTDGRYYEHAAMQLDSNWALMKSSEADTLKIFQWLSKHLQKGNKVGVDPHLYDMQKYRALDKNLNDSGLHLVSVTPNLVDEIWPNKPAKPNETLIILPIKYTEFMEPWTPKWIPCLRPETRKTIPCPADHPRIDIDILNLESYT